MSAHLRHWVVVITTSFRENRKWLIARRVEKQHQIVPVQHGRNIFHHRHPQREQVFIVQEVNLGGNYLVEVPSRGEVAEQHRVWGRGLQEDVDRLQDLADKPVLILPPQWSLLHEERLQPLLDVVVHERLGETLPKAGLAPVLPVGPGDALADPLYDPDHLRHHHVFPGREPRVLDLVGEALQSAAQVVHLLRGVVLHAHPPAYRAHR
mmetsp:Transcript_58137/g.154544  ORF Transcript_58137/g.154544 Transcript_58137/m.154544 type:complete len:208 (+) Transcript_58137:2151-2774(+)